MLQSEVRKFIIVILQKVTVEERSNVETRGCPQAMEVSLLALSEVKQQENQKPVSGESCGKPKL